DIFSPDIFSPDIFSPDIFSPDIFSPDIFSPDIFSPDIFSPDIFSPDIFSPDIFSPDIFSPDIFSPDPSIYSSAQLRSLIGVSALESTANESISVRSWSNSGDFYIRVRGRYGAFAPNEDFTLDVAVQAGGCAGFVPSSVPFGTPVTANGYRTIILTDITRMSGTDQEKADLQAAIEAFANRADVQGVVVELDQDPRIVDANALADAAFDCPHAKNVLADDIKSIIDSFWEINPLEYVVVIGNDNVIPFYRHPDQALLANESNYVPPVADDTASQASLRLGYVLGQDRYGSKVELSLRSDTLVLPELAVGRLVETPTDVLNMIAAFEATNGIMPTPQSSFITGYDFLEDAAEAVQVELERGIGNAANTLITPQSVSPMDTDNPELWTADDLRSEFLTQRHDVVYLAGHFSAFSALAADYSTRMLASELADSTVDLTNTLVFSTGCHSGYNTVNEHGIPNITVEPDWAQAFAQKGSTLIAGTGYQYGDTEFIEYNERLYRDFALQLRAGSGPVSIGKALVEAKNVYLANTPELRPLHEKSLLEVTLYGFPMMSIDMPEGRDPDLSNDSMVGSTTPYATNPGLTLGLEYADVTLPFTLSEVETDLTDATNSENIITTTHFEGKNGVVANTSEPVLPLFIQNVGMEDTVLRGIGFRGGEYVDTAGLVPLTGAATTELRSVHAPFLAEAFFPVKPYDANYIGALTDAAGGATNLIVTPAQYVSDGPLSTSGIWRQYDDMSFRLFYSDNIGTFGENVPALANPPSIVSISAQSDGGFVNFEVVVQGDPSAGLQEVWVTYTSSDGSFNGLWQSIDLVQDANNSLLWTGSLLLDGNTPSNMRYIVQAVNGVGGVSLAANGGFYYTPDNDPDPTADPTAANTELAIISAPADGDFGGEIDVTAELTSNGSAVDNKVVSISLDGQTRQALTDTNGRVTVSIPLLGTPGDTAIKATFGGDADFLPASAEAAFTIDKEETVIALALDPDPAVVLPGEDSGIVATLTDSLNRPLLEKTLIFIISGTNGETAVSLITDYVGEVSLGVVDLPAGNYTVDVYFSGDIPLPDGTLSLEDSRYLPAVASTTLSIVPPNSDPIAVDDEATTDENTAAIIDVLENDSDPDEDGLSVVAVSDPANGTAVINEDNTVTYTPEDEFVGEDSFTYTIEDGNEGQDTATVTVTVVEVPDELTCDPNAPGVNVIYGTESHDRIFGTNGDDVIFGLGGNDRIFGRNGNDCIVGGDGNDQINTGGGDDIAFGNAGNDKIVGQTGNDQLFGGEDNDYLNGNSGDDILDAGDGKDTVFGGFGMDIIDGGNGNDYLGGQDGDDIINGGAGDDELIGNSGDDTLNGGDDFDICHGGVGFDTTEQCELLVITEVNNKHWWTKINN
ncbi:MAG: Ig-like domain-containing protein, partial [Chloroflexota bacterium]